MDCFAEIDMTTFATRQLETARIQPRLLHERSMKIAAIARILRRIESEFIGSSLNGSAFDFTTCDPRTETEGKAGGLFGPRRLPGETLNLFASQRTHTGGSPTSYQPSNRGDTRRSRRLFYFG